MSITTLRKKISLTAMQLDQKYRDHILAKMKERFEKTCSRAVGYIESVESILTIHDNVISAGDSMTVFDVTFNITASVPAVGDVIKGKVCFVADYSVLVSVNATLKIVISSKNMEGYKYDAVSECYRSGKDTIGLEDIISVELTTVRYEKKKYNCIGRLKVS